MKFVVYNCESSLWGYGTLMVDGVSEEKYQEHVSLLTTLGWNATLLDNDVNFPGMSIMLAESYYDSGNFIPLSDAFLNFTLPDLNTSVESIITNGEQEVYYNLQGIRVNYHEKGELYIRIQGSKASKVMF